MHDAIITPIEGTDHLYAAKFDSLKLVLKDTRTVSQRLTGNRGRALIVDRLTVNGFNFVTSGTVNYAPFLDEVQKLGRETPEVRAARIALEQARAAYDRAVLDADAAL